MINSDIFRGIYDDAEKYHDEIPHNEETPKDLVEKKEKASKYYRYSWWLFANEEDFLYCQILSRNPESQPNVAFFPEISVSHPELGAKKFNLNNLFRTRAVHIGTDRLTKRHVEFSDVERYRDFSSLLKEIDEGKILGLCAANVMEGMSKQKMLDIDPNELYWKWDSWSKQKLDDEYIIIELKVINVTNVVDGKERCNEAKGISGAKVRLYIGEKESANCYKVTSTEEVETTNPHGYACFILKKQDYDNKKLLFGALKGGFKIAPQSVTIHDRLENEGFNPDQPCGNPEDVIDTTNQSRINGIRIPLVKKGKFEGNVYPLVELVNGKKITQYVPSENKEKSADYHFKTVKNREHILGYKPDNIYVAMYIFDIYGEKVVNDIDNNNNKWWLLEGNKRISTNPEKFNIVVTDPKFKLIEIKENLSFHTNKKRSKSEAALNYIRKYFEKIDDKNKKFLISVMLIDAEEYDKEDSQSKLTEELKIVIKTANESDAFRNFVKDNPDRRFVIYDFDSLIIDYNKIKENETKEDKKNLDEAKDAIKIEK